MPGQALGLVGESGCGKSTVALGVMRDLGKNGRIVGGSIRFKGRELTTMTDAELRKIRGSEIAMIYQEPMASLNPAMKVGRQLMEVPMIHEGASAAAARAKALRDRRGGAPARPRSASSAAIPHQLSGGQQQRIVIAMALMSKPALLILDEPTTALDVTVEAGIVDLVKDLGREFGTSMLFISHNLGLVLETCDRICVMYSGEAVETGPIAEVFDAMRHPYTQGLFRSIPLPGADKTTRPLIAIPGNFPLPHERPPGCNFGPRCSYFAGAAATPRDIPMLPVTPTHASRCLRFDEIDWDAPPPARRGGRGRADRRRGAAGGQPARSTTRSARTRSSAATPGWSRPTSRSASRRARPRRWPSSASPAAASRPSPRCCSGSRPRPAAR